MDSRIKSIIEPLVQNGENIRNTVIQELQSTGDWNYMTDTDKSELLMLSDAQLAAVSLVLSEEPPIKLGDDTQYNVRMLRSCVGVALGISGIKNLVTGTMALGSVTTAVQALKIIGGRYMSYIGIAWMIWDFYDCMQEIEERKPQAKPLKDADNIEIKGLN